MKKPEVNKMEPYFQESFQYTTDDETYMPELSSDNSQHLMK